MATTKRKKNSAETLATKRRILRARAERKARGSASLDAWHKTQVRKEAATKARAKRAKKAPPKGRTTNAAKKNYSQSYVPVLSSYKTRLRTMHDSEVKAEWADWTARAATEPESKKWLQPLLGVIRREMARRNLKTKINPASLFGPAAVKAAKPVVKLARVKEKETGELGTVTGLARGYLKIKWDDRAKPALARPSTVRVVNHGRGCKKNPCKCFKNPLGDILAESLIGETVKRTLKNGRKAVSRKGAKAQRRAKRNGPYYSHGYLVIWSLMDGKAASEKYFKAKANALSFARTTAQRLAKFPLWHVRVRDMVTGKIVREWKFKKNPSKRRTVIKAAVIKKVVVNKAGVRGRVSGVRGNPKPKIQNLKPGAKPSRAAAAKFAEFQGRPGKPGSADVSPLAKGAKLYAIGKLVEIKLKGLTVGKPPRASQLLADTRGRMWISEKIGKPQPGLKAGQLTEVGKIQYVVYRARKVHIIPHMENYIHRLGEETGAQPTLYLDPQGFGVIKGGAYTMTPEGIRN